MKKISFLTAALLLSICSFSFIAQAASSTNQIISSDQFQSLPAQLQTPQAFFTATVTEITKEGNSDIEGNSQRFQDVKLKITSGKDSGQEISVKNGGIVNIDDNQLVRVGQTVVVAKTGEKSYFIADRYRLPYMFLAILLFVLLVIYFGRWKGAMSIVALVLSFVVLVSFVIPALMKGYSALWVTIIGSFIIATFGMMLSHGFSRRTVVALISSLLTLVMAIGLSVLFVDLVQLFGNGSDEAAYLKLDPNLHLNLKGLLLGGIIIGTLGVLDDVTIAQVAAIDELHSANEKLGPTELYRRGISIGKEHIASVVNTLVLAYAGASLPLFLLFTIDSVQPLWVTLNSEFIAEEIVRTFIGSVALILAVPISTYLASRYLSHPRHHSSKEVA